MFFKYIVLALVSITFMACSSIKMPKATYATHDSMHDIPAVDEMIVSMKKEYIDKCYAPVVHKEPPENACQTELFQQLERRYHTNYNQQQVNMASDDLFLEAFDKWEKAVLRGREEDSEDIMFWYRNLLDLKEETFNNVPERIKYYL